MNKRMTGTLAKQKRSIVFHYLILFLINAAVVSSSSLTNVDQKEVYRKLRNIDSLVDQLIGVQVVEESTVHQIDSAEDDKDLIWSGSRADRPEVAWILSFGASGTSFTITNTEKMTNLTTASNYGRDYVPCESIDSRGQGPYVRSLNKKLPKNFIMTKTHCGGYCTECDPSEYLHTEQSFEVECRTGQKRRPKGEVIKTTYSQDIPKRAIHLIRNPFDTLIGRMHLQIKHFAKRDTNAKWNGLDDYSGFTNDVQGLEAWCNYLDSNYRDADLKAFPKAYISKYLNTVPCHSQWFQYIQWHNHAYKVHQDILPMPVHYMHYENYTSNFHGSVQEMFEFLQFPSESLSEEPLQWIAGKSYLSFFSQTHLSEATKMVRELAHPEVWNLLRHYFDGLS